MLRTILFLFLSLLTIPTFAGNNSAQNKLNNVNKNFFIENKGQWPSEVKYLARVGGMNAWITNSGVLYDYFQIIRNYNQSETMKMPRDKKEEFERKNISVNGHVVKMSLVDANKECVEQGNNKREGYYNYFIGNDNSKWASFVGLYGDVAQNDIYKNIDVKYYFDGNTIRYDYIVKPGADLSQLRMKFEGQESIRVNEAGELVIKTSLGEVTNGKLYSYQFNEGSKNEVACKFVQGEDGTVNLSATGYDRSKELIIDPLVYSTFIGGEDDDDAYSIALDGIQNSYLTGYTHSGAYPITPGAYHTNYSNDFNAFVTKLNSEGNELIYSTFIGGNNEDDGFSISVDGTGNAYITGLTASTDYPTTPGAFNTKHNGGGSYGDDIFVTKLNQYGSALVYSTFIGGNNDDWGNSIKVDPNGYAYISGWTASSNYPVTNGAYQTTFGGGRDVFVSKLNPTGTGLIYSTFIGSTGEDCGYSIAIDTGGCAYITGRTGSFNYPTTPGAFQTVFGGGYCDAFITKINPIGSALIYSTFIGGNMFDQAQSIIIDLEGNAYLTGYTQSLNYPTTPGSYQTIFGSGNQRAFVTKLNKNGNSLIYSTFIGGNVTDFGNSIAIDIDGKASITGNTESSNFPTTYGAFQHQFKGGGSVYQGGDAFITELNPLGSSLVYSTYLGGSGDDAGNGIAIDVNGNKYITGTTSSVNYPVTLGAYRITNRGWRDVFVTKLNMIPEPIQLTTPNGGEIWKAGDIKIITWEAVGISNIKIQYSTNLGLSWNIIIENYPTLIDSFRWTVPFISSNQTLVKISDVGDSAIFDISNNPFRIWQVFTNIQNSIVGQNNLNFGPTNVSLNLFILKPSQITATYYEYETPQQGIFPNHVSGVLPYYWKISASDSLSFNNGFISVPYSSLRGILYSNWIIVWLKRTNSGDAWTNIGGDIIAGNFVSTIPFSSFSEFAIGLYYTPTPVELTSFIVNSNNGIVKLIWSTATEINNRGFEIQRKSYTYDFITVAFVNGKGTAIMSNNYSWSEKLQPGKYSYRLKQVDFNGKFEYSQEVEVLVVTKNFSLEQNYPNPFNPATTIRYQIPKPGLVTLKVYDILGREVASLVNENKVEGVYDFTFNASRFTSGVYIYQLKVNDYVSSKKMIMLK